MFCKRHEIIVVVNLRFRGLELGHYNEFINFIQSQIIAAQDEQPY